jgi:hypothetical protein
VGTQTLAQSRFEHAPLVRWEFNAAMFVNKPAETLEVPVSQASIESFHD